MENIPEGDWWVTYQHRHTHSTFRRSKRNESNFKTVVLYVVSGIVTSAWTKQRVNGIV